ncbi:MAG: CAAX prenyl protease-related protein [Chthoniobacterales bacterium]
MNSVSNPEWRSKLAAYVVPMVAFLVLMAPVSFLQKMGDAFWLQSAEHLVYPVQTIFCAALLVWYWRHYEFHRLARIFFSIAVAVFVVVLWISPQAFFGVAARTDGFNPETFAIGSIAYWGALGMRFLRLVIVVPLVEEIFWRGFLLRYLIDEKFASVPFGKFSWLSFGVVTVAFTFAHSSADWMAAAVTGALYNFVAYRTRSLSSCVLAHAVTNLLLGLWIVYTKQWGFW